jgi:hypothetical protein
MTALDTGAADYLFKLIYKSGLKKEALLRGNQLLLWAAHETDFTSATGIRIPVAHTLPQGIGASNAEAATAATPSGGAAFLVPQRSITHFAELNGNVVRNAMNGGDESQFYDALELEVDNATNMLGMELNQRMYGASDGVRSFLSSTGAINTTTGFLNAPQDSSFYERNMRLQFVNPATGALRTGGTGYVVIDKVDRINGQLTFTVALNAAVTDVVAGDGIVRWSMNTKDMDGVKGWCPATVASNDNFLGVNRSYDRTQLAGIYTDQSAIPVRSGLLAALGWAQNLAGKRFDENAPAFINPKNLTQIRQTVEAARIVTDSTETEYGMGIKTFEIMGTRFIQDSHCPVDEVIFIGKGAFTRGSCGNQPVVESQDGRKFYYGRRTGVLEFCLVHDGNSFSRQTWNLMRVKIAAVAA